MRIRTVIAFGIGYVLGTRAGRERYEQLQQWWSGFIASDAAQAILARGRRHLGSGLDAAKEVAATGLSTASEQVRRLAD